MHWKRWRRHGDPNFVRHRRGVVRDAQGRKECGLCGDWLPESRFTRNANNSDGLGSWCRACASEWQRLWRYGVTPEQFDDLLLEQAGCAICHTDAPTGRGWVVDHDHACCAGTRSCGQCVRGVLCPACNSAIGHLRDNPAVLESAILYLTGANS